MFSPLRRWFRERGVKVVFSFNGKERKVLEEDRLWLLRNFFGLRSLPPSLPAYPHHCSRQLQESTRAKTHWLNGTTVLPDMQNIQPSDDARWWYKLVMCKQEWSMTSFICLGSKCHHLHCTKPTIAMVIFVPLFIDTAIPRSSRNKDEQNSIHGHHLTDRRAIPNNMESHW